jgi:hypothetical protein
VAAKKIRNGRNEPVRAFPHGTVFTGNARGANFMMIVLERETANFAWDTGRVAMRSIQRSIHGRSGEFGPRGSLLRLFNQA